MKGLVGILDQDLEYATGLSAGLLKQKDIPFEVVVFSDAVMLRDYARGRTVDILLLGDCSLLGTESWMHWTEKIVLLGEGSESEWGSMPCIRRFQSVSQIYREILFFYEAARRGRSQELERTVRIYTVYSPVRRSLRTSFSLVLAKTLSASSRTLYLNLEDYSWVGEALQTSGEDRGGELVLDLSDALYYFEQGMLEGHLQALVLDYHGLEYILPVRCPEDIRQANSTQLMALIQTIGQAGRYQNVVLDAGDALGDPLPVLQQSHRIFVPARGDAVSHHRIGQFSHYLERQGQGALIERLQVLQLPFQKGNRWGKEYLEQLFWGELGDMVKNLKL